MPYTVPKLLIDKTAEKQRKDSLKKGSSKSGFLGVGEHDVVVKAVEEQASKKGNLFLRIVFAAGEKTINTALWLPDGQRAYNPKSMNSIKLESFLNAAANADIVPGTKDYPEKLQAGLEYFTQPEALIGRECRIKVDYPYSTLHAEPIGEGKFQLKNGRGELVDGDDTIFPDRESVEAHVQKLNADRDEDKLFRFSRFPEVLFINPPENPQGVPVLDKNLEDVEDEDDISGF